VADLCTSSPLPLLAPEGDHRAACWIPLGRPEDGGSRPATAGEVSPTV
jgi:hypothetical protein